VVSGGARENDEGIVDEAVVSEANEPRRNRRLWARILIVFIVFVVAAAVAVHFFTSERNQAANPISPPPLPVVAATARIGNIPVYLSGLGTVTALNTVTVRSRVDGQLMNFAVREGQMVAEGDSLAQIDPRPFQVQLLQAQGQMQRDQAILANARTDLERYRILYAQDSVPKQQLDTQLATVNQYEGIIKADQAAIDDAKLQLTYTHITSPITGRIGLRQIDPGNIIHVSDQNGLAIITQLQPITVIFNIAQDFLPAVMKRLQGETPLRVEAYDRDFKNRIASGTLLTIDNQVDVNTGTVRFKATFPNENNALFPNQFVNARLLLDVKRRVVLIPTGAIQRGPQATFVYVVKLDSTVETRNITVGIIENDVASIDKGLSAGEIVVTEGVDKLRPGMTVAIRQSNGVQARPNGSRP
jgi:membrane fusion protein, multidrug efflux system